MQLHMSSRDYVLNTEVSAQPMNFVRTAAAQSRTPKIEAVKLQNHYADTLWNKRRQTFSEGMIAMRVWLRETMAPESSTFAL